MPFRNPDLSLPAPNPAKIAPRTGRHPISITRRSFLKTASALGASLAFSRAQALPATRAWRERRDLYPEVWRPAIHRPTASWRDRRRGVAGDMRRSAAATGAPLLPNAPRSSTRFATPASPGSPSSQAIGTRSGPDFRCIPRPIERSGTPDGGPLLYRVSHRVRLWKKGERPKLEQRVLEGRPDLSM